MLVLHRMTEYKQCALQAPVTTFPINSICDITMLAVRVQGHSSACDGQHD